MRRGLFKVEVASERGLPPHFEGAKLTQDDAIVVNLGKSLQALTNGYYVATTHRVAQREKRYSAAFFYGPRLAMPLRPILHGEQYKAAQLVGAERAQHDATTLTSALDASEGTAGDLVVSLMARSYPQRAQELLLSGVSRL